MEKEPGKKGRAKLVLVLLAVALILVISGYLILRDTDSVEYPPTIATFYTAPEPTDETTAIFRRLFLESDDKTNQAFEGLAGHLTDLRGYEDQSPKPSSYWLAIDGTWSRFEPTLRQFRALSEQGPYPLELRALDDPGIDATHLASLVEIHLLRARSLQQQGRDPSEALVPVFRFLDHTFRSASGLMDLLHVLKSYRQILQHLEVETIADHPDLRNPATYWLAQWRTKLSVALKLEFFLFKDYLVHTGADEYATLTSLPSAPPFPLVSGLLFKKNVTLNRYWVWVDRLGAAIINDDPAAFTGVEAEMQSLDARTNWPNLIGVTLLKTVIPNIPAIYEQHQEVEAALTDEPAPVSTANAVNGNPNSAS